MYLLSAHSPPSRISPHMISGTPEVREGYLKFNFRRNSYQNTIYFILKLTINTQSILEETEVINVYNDNSFIREEHKSSTLPTDHRPQPTTFIIQGTAHSFSFNIR